VPSSLASIALRSLCFQLSRFPASQLPGFPALLLFALSSMPISPQKPLFRFQDLEIWKLAVEIGNKLFDIAERLDKKKLYRFAEQLRGAGLSMSNNVAEGSGSTSAKEFIQFLNIARRSTFENANMILIFRLRGYITDEEKDDLLADLDSECRMISGFMKKLRTP
jgi:four helix bundle protein